MTKLKFNSIIVINLKNAGYFVNELKKGLVNIIALNGEKVLCLQLKKNCRPSKVEYDEFYDINVPNNAYKIVVIKMANGFELNYVGKEPGIDEKMNLLSDITGREVFI